MHAQHDHDNGVCNCVLYSIRLRPGEPALVQFRTDLMTSGKIKKNEKRKRKKKKLLLVHAPGGGGGGGGGGTHVYWWYGDVPL